MLAKYIPFYRRRGTLIDMLFLPEQHFPHGFTGLGKQYEAIAELMNALVGPSSGEVRSGLLSGGGVVWGIDLEAHEVVRYLQVFGREWDLATQISTITLADLDEYEEPLALALKGVREREASEERSRLRKKKWGF